MQAGDAGAINAQADAFHTAAGSATEVEDDFQTAKRRFEKGWQHNGVEHPINESTEVTQAAETVHLQKPQLSRIALDLETVAAALATAQRTCDAQIAALNVGLHGIDDEIGTARAANQDTQALHEAAVAAVQVTLADVLDTRNAYAATMAGAKASIAKASSTADGIGDAGALAPAGGNPAGRTNSVGDTGASVPTGDTTGGLTPTGSDVALGSAGAIAGGTADGVGKATLKVLAASPTSGPGAPSPSLWKWLEDPKVGGVELKGFSRLGRVVGAAGAVPAVISDIGGGNSVAEAVTREGVGTAVGLGLGAFAADALTGGVIGSAVPGVGTAVGVVVGAGVATGTAFGTSKLIESYWNPITNVVTSAAGGVKSIFSFG